MVIECDTTKGEVGFIVVAGGYDKPILIAVGSNKKSARQISKNQLLSKSRYGLIITNGPLRLDEINRIVYLPFEFFLLT